MILRCGDDYTQSEVYHPSGPCRPRRAASLYPQVLPVSSVKTFHIVIHAMPQEPFATGNDTPPPLAMWSSWWAERAIMPCFVFSPDSSHFLQSHKPNGGPSLCNGWVSGWIIPSGPPLGNLGSESSPGHVRLVGPSQVGRSHEGGQEGAGCS